MVAPWARVVRARRRGLCRQPRQAGCSHVGHESSNASVSEACLSRLMPSTSCPSSSGWFRAVPSRLPGRIPFACISPESRRSGRNPTGIPAIRRRPGGDFWSRAGVAADSPLLFRMDSRLARSVGPEFLVESLSKAVRSLCFSRMLCNELCRRIPACRFLASIRPSVLPVPREKVRRMPKGRSNQAAVSATVACRLSDQTANSGKSNSSRSIRANVACRAASVAQYGSVTL